MRRTRVLAAAAATSILMVGPLAGLASAGTTPAGVGTGTVSATALRIDLGANGDLLSIRVLGDDGTATIDPAKGTPVSSETLRPLTITSKKVPALNLAVPPVSTTSKGTEDKKSVEPSLPSSAAFSGKLNALVSSLVDRTGARSGMSAGLANLKLAGGLVNVPTGLVQVSSDAASGKATATRSITIPDMRVLDLSAVLDGLGLELSDLSVNQVLGLLKGLGVTLPGIADPAAVVSSLNTAIDTIKAQTGNITASLCATVDGLLAPLGGVTGLVGGTVGSAIGALPQVPTSGSTGSLPSLGGSAGGGSISLPPVLSPVLGGLALHAAALPSTFSCSNLTGTVQDLLTTVQGTLGKVLAGGLAQLGDTALLSVKDVKVALTATATDEVGTSVADSFVDIAWWQAFVPARSGYRPVWVGLGTVAVDLLLAVVLTSLLRHRLGLNAWRSVHLLVWPAWLVGVGHAMALGTDLEAQTPWAVLPVVGCLLAVGEGRRPVTWPAEVMSGRRRDQGVRVVPAHGLTLEEVGYPDDAELAAQADRARARREAIDA